MATTSPELGVQLGTYQLRGAAKLLSPPWVPHLTDEGGGPDGLRGRFQLQWVAAGSPRHS